MGGLASRRNDRVVAKIKKVAGVESVVLDLVNVLPDVGMSA
jgi:hypothetical protein